MEQYIEYLEIESQIGYLKYQLESLEAQRDALGEAGEPPIEQETSFEFMQDTSCSKLR